MKWEEARVFISSTFNDMHAERDYLVKEVFPELTEWCEKRKIRLTDIDLRWGVTEEDSSNSKTIETCLRHVDKSRPFFLCFLGQRRGWVPNFDKDISDETVKRYNDIAKYKTRSATEMEIEHALLEPLEILIHENEKETGECRHSIFFFRNGDYADEKNEFLSEKQRLIYTNEYLKIVDVSKVMSKLKGNENEEGKNPKLYDEILSQIKDEFTSGEIKYPEFISELIYDIQNTDCNYYNKLMDDLVKNPLKKNNLVIVAELKFKNPGLYKEIIHEIKDNDEKLYDNLMGALAGYEYRDIGIDEFCELFDDGIIKEIVDDIKNKNEEVFKIHEDELSNIRKKIENKQSKANKSNNNLSEKEQVHIIINDYKGEWKKDLKLPELSHYKFGEGNGKLTNFECDGKPLKDVIINEFKKQFEMEFKNHIQEIANKNPEIYENEESEIIKKGEYSQDISDVDKKLVNELDQQENFCHNNSEGFVRRDEYTNILKEYVESSDNGICLVSAEAGLGKTMLLADFATNFEKNYENKRLYKRFCGGSDLSSKTYTLWKSIIDEAKIDSNKKFYPQNIVDLRRNIDDILEEISKNEDVVIIIDAINQMEDGLEMINWFNNLPDNLKLIISVKEVNIDDESIYDDFEKDEREKQKELDRLYQEKLEIIKKKKTISDKHSFSLNKLDYKKEDNIKEYVDNIKEYVESNDKNICLINSELNYDKSLIFHIFNDKYSDKKIYNFKCILNNSTCPTDKTKKSVREFGDDKTIFEVVEIAGKVEDIKTKLESHISEMENDSIVMIDVMSNDAVLFDNLVNINYNSKTIIGFKEHENDEITFNGQSDYSFDIKELDPEKNKIIKSYLENYLKELDEKEVHDICNFKGSKNPLFLKILLAELRVFGSFDQLKDEIKSFGDSPLSAFDHVLERLEEDEGVRGENTEIAKPLFSLLASSRVGGLSEEEIVTIIKDKYDLDEKYVRSNVNLNLRQVRPFMARKEMRHDFFYEKFREAAEKRYNADYENNIELLTDYFKDKSSMDEQRRYVELPYYLNESGRVEELENTLSSYSFIKNKLYKTKDVYGLISDYNYLNFEEVEDEKVEGEKVEDGPLELIQRGLELSSPVLISNPKELPVQLWGRMNEIKEDEEEQDKHKYDKIRALLDDLVEDTNERWLKPTSAVLYSPKSSIIKRLLPDGNKSSSQISFTKDNKIIFGSSDGVLSLYDVDDNSFEVLEKDDSKIVKTFLDEDELLYVARSNGDIKKWNLTTRDTEDFPKIDAEITDIYLSKTYNKIYASSHSGIFSIDLSTKELRKEDIEEKNYNQILVPRRNEAILVCDEREVDGWDVYEMRKAYNKQHQQNDDEESGTKLDSSEEIRFMGLNKRFLTLISENGQMKFWNTLKNSGGGESIAEAQVCSPNDKFTQAITLEDKNEIITISDMGVMRVWDIPQPRSPQFDVAKNEKTGMKMDIQTGIKSPTSIDYYNNGKDNWVIVGNENNDISVIDLDKKVEESDAVRHAESVLSIKIDGNHMITASDNGEIFTWDFDNEEFKNEYTNDFRCNSISFNREDSKLVLAGVKAEKDGRKTYKIATCTVSDDMWEDNGNESIELESEETINSKEIIDIAQNNSGIVFIDEDKLSLGGSETKFDKTATTLATKFDSDDAYVGFEDGSIVRYPSGEAFSEIDSPVTKIKVSDDKVIAGYENGSIEILDLDLSSHEHLDAHEKAVTNFYVDETQLISLGKDNTIKFWDIDSKECKYTYYLDIFATSINLKDGKLVVGDTLGNVRFFIFENA